MKKRRCFKKAIAGISVLAMGVSTIMPAMPAVAAEEQMDTKVRQGDNMQLTAEEAEGNDYVLYTVNCGTPDPSVVPNQDQERMGLFQSNVDQAFGADTGTGAEWGRKPNDAYSAAINNGSDATDIGNSFIYMSDGSDITFDKYKSALGYNFELPTEKIEGLEENTYEVTLAFKHYWDNRLVNIMLEGETVATDISVNYGEWVSRTFTTKVTDGELNLLVKSPRRTSGKEDPILNYVKVRAVKEELKEVPEYSSFTGTKGDTLYDTNGNQIQAHGGQIQQLTVDGKTKWYWIGEDKTNDYRPVGGIHMYSSDDLYNWKDEGIVLRTMEDPEQFESDAYFRELYGNESQEQKDAVFVDLDKNNCVMERPKMIYNDQTNKYVIWFHADGRYPGSDADYGKAKAGVAISDSPNGPFKLLGSYKLNSHNDPNGNLGYDGWEGRGSVRDMNLFKDDDGTAYVIYSSEGNQTMYVSKLNDDYTGLKTAPDVAVEGVDFTRNFEGWSREAPAMFKYRDKYYVVTSGCTGWSPNQAKYAVADTPMGPWTEIGDPCTDWGSGTTYDTQSTCVFPVDAENGKFIYMGDRWNAGDLSESRYVWVPVEFQPDNKIALRRYEDWTLDDLNDKGLFDIITELPSVVSSVTDIMKQLPSEVTISYGTDEETTPVTWSMGEYDENKIGIVTITGNLTEKGREFSRDIYIVNPSTLYFFDSGAEKSEYFDAVKKELGNKVLNTVTDQKYTEENKAGYTGVTEAESPESFDIGLHDGKSLQENGWWAGDGKNIEYAFDLNPGTYTLAAGFQEWWDTQRDMKLSIKMGDQVLAEQDFTLAANDGNLQVSQSFEVTEAGKAVVTVSKRGSANPVLSWIGVLGSVDEPSVGVNKNSLQHAITMAEKLEAEQDANNCYTEESWAKVQKALDDARTVMADTEALQEDVDYAFLKLISSCNLLTDGIQKMGLNAVIEGTKAILENEEELAEYTEESVEAVRKALADAEKVYAESGADQETVNAAARKLMDAVTGMLVKTEETRLDILIRKAEELLKNKDQYTSASAANLEKVLAEAKKVAGNSQASEAQINESYANLAKAMTDLVRKGDKAELKNALDKANEIIANSGKYLEDTISGLQAVITEAQTVYDSGDADTEKVGEVLKKLVNEILKARLKGDADLNGVVDTRDSAEVLKYDAELKTLTKEQIKAADVNEDGAANTNDAVSILKYAAGKIEEF
ncbi:family 43 glycosylhydrolase [Robinsoniella sp. KNHs210]|uniref:family 43 glycosylhydrolase n=1 Tax=Robinsoniella sp. KNHs210 TaxID=1469950 RepID=UPI000485C9ED|nr:family 43 glycosylhydrolase [Robinsoniella sp. KNHs210]